MCQYDCYSVVCKLWNLKRSPLFNQSLCAKQFEGVMQDVSLLNAVWCPTQIGLFLTFTILACFPWHFDYCFLLNPITQTCIMTGSFTALQHHWIFFLHSTNMVILSSAATPRSTKQFPPPSYNLTFQKVYLVCGAAQTFTKGLLCVNVGNLYRVLTSFSALSDYTLNTPWEQLGSMCDLDACRGLGPLLLLREKPRAKQLLSDEYSSQLPARLPSAGTHNPEAALIRSHSCQSSTRHWLNGTLA